MRKRFLTYSLALAMAVTMAAPQAAVLPASLRAVNVYAAEEDTTTEAKTGTALTKVKYESSSWADPAILFEELDKYGSQDVKDYIGSVTKVVVNEKEYVADWDDSGENNKYEFSMYGFRVYLGSVVDGENTITIYANRYKDKKIVVNVNKDAATAELVSQTDIDGTGENPVTPKVDKNPLNNMLTAAKAYEQDSASDEKWQALQNAIIVAQEVYDNENATQEDVNGAVTSLRDAIDAFTKKEDSGQTGITNPVEAGEYTLSYSAVSDSGETSMIQRMFDGKAKLTVGEDGKMKVSMLNTQMMSFLIDFTLTADKDTYVTSEGKNFGTLDDKGNYIGKEFTVEVSDLTKSFTAAALVSAMGGQNDDIGNLSKYTTATLTFTSVTDGWNGYDAETPAETDADQVIIDALVDAGYDSDGDGKLSDAEWNSISGEVELSDKGLTDVSLLKKLPATVTSLNLSNNNIKEIPEGLLDGKTALENFYIEGNHIKDIPAGLFKDATNLNWISLSGNKLTSIEKDDFAGLNNLTILDLTANEISTIEADAFKDLTKMDDLGLGTNNLSSLPEDLFAPMANSLRSVSFYENAFTQIPKAVEKVKSLETLSIFDNKITSVDNIDFSKMASLKTLNLKSNEITELPSGMLAKNANIESVDFFDNRIISVSADMFPKIDGGIHKLDLQLNEMTVVDPAVRRMAKGFNKQYPQKTALSFTASQAGTKEIKWSQDLSILDLMFWYDETQSDQQSEIADLETYKITLQENYPGQNLVDILNDKYWDWDIVTEIQQKKEDGSFVTIDKSTSSEKADEVSGSLKVDANGTYRVKKTVYAGTSGSKPYRFTVYSNDVTVKDSGKQDNNNNSTTQKKPQTTTQKKSQTTTQKKQNTSKVKVAKVKKLKAKNLAGKKVKLSWKKVNGASGYKVYRATKKNGKYTLVKTIKNVKTVKFTDKKVKKNKTYYYKVSAYKTIAKKVVKGAYSAKAKVRVKR